MDSETKEMLRRDLMKKRHHLEDEELRAVKQDILHAEHLDPVYAASLKEAIKNRAWRRLRELNARKEQV